MGKIFVTPVLVISACIIASFLGFLQDMLTYSISAEWYHDWKFIQFDIPNTLHGRLGAAIVGVLATWWMGLFLSVPILLACIFAPGWREMADIFLRAALIVLVVTLGAELLAYAYSLLTLDISETPEWAQPPRFENPMGVTHVQFINATGYLAAAGGSLIALMYAIWRVIRARKSKECAR